MTPVRSRPFACRTAILSGLLAALLSVPAFADDAADVTKLMRSGQLGPALTKVETALRKSPRDPQLRFLKGVILTEQNKTAEAIAVFFKLTEDHPSLPEPYNNLAVLYAAAGQYDKARTALDAAIRTNPSYATAYENLGDIHAKLASQAYDKALQLDSDNSTAKSKLTLVHSLVGNMNDAVLAQAPTAEAAPAAVKPKPAEKPAPVTAPAKSEPVTAAKTKPEAKPEIKPEAKTEAKPEAKPSVDADGEREQVMEAVNGWAKAWSTRDVQGYLSHYGSDFRIPGGQSRKRWEEGRRDRIVNKERITVTVNDPKVTINGNKASVKFRQTYVSDSFTANTNKTLVLSRQNGKWLIQQELAGN